MKPSTRVAVIGAGTMGHGIAYVVALAGCDVRLTDARAEGETATGISGKEAELWEGPSTVGKAVSSIGGCY